MPLGLIYFTGSFVVTTELALTTGFLFLSFLVSRRVKINGGLLTNDLSRPISPLPMGYN